MDHHKVGQFRAAPVRNFHLMSSAESRHGHLQPIYSAGHSWCLHTLCPHPLPASRPSTIVKLCTCATRPDDPFPLRISGLSFACIDFAKLKDLEQIYDGIYIEWPLHTRKKHIAPISKSLKHTWLALVIASHV